MTLQVAKLRSTLKTARHALTRIRTTPIGWDQAAVKLVELQHRPGSKRLRYVQYLYGLLSAARTANATGARRFTAIEFGVAGGNGLVAMEEHAATVERLCNVRVDIVGFDMSSGLPARTNPRDCPFAFVGGEFEMDEGKLRARLKRADLRLGDVAETARAFAAENLAPIGFVSNDFDLYTSTRDSFILYDLPAEKLLPRITMYFDDLHGYPYTSATGQWAAIDEFNATRKMRRFGQIMGLKHCLGENNRFATWVESMFVMHAFDHPDYNAREESTMHDTSLRN